MGWAPLTMLSMSGLPSASRNGPGRGVGHGYADAAGFTLVDVVAGEEKVILAVGMDGRGRPHGAFHPLHLVVGDDPGMLLPVYEVFRREGVHEGLLVVVGRVGRVDPVGVAEDHPFGVGVPAREDGVAAPAAAEAVFCAAAQYAARHAKRRVTYFISYSIRVDCGPR